MLNLQTNQTLMPDRRQFPRVSLCCEFIVRADNVGEFAAATIDLSFGGAFFETEKQLLTGSEVSITLKKDDAATVSKARVVHRYKSGYGVSFIDPSEDFYNNLTDILFDHVVSNVRLGAPEDTIPARIAFFCADTTGDRVLFSTHLSPQEIWLLSDQPAEVDDTFWITLTEHGMFDCEVRVVWCKETTIGVEFISPSDEFRAAYERIFNSFLGQ